MATPNPRFDPQPGDTMFKISAARQVVRRVTGRTVDRVQFCSGEKPCETSLISWRAWAVDATSGVPRVR